MSESGLSKKIELLIDTQIALSKSVKAQFDTQSAFNHSIQTLFEAMAVGNSPTPHYRKPEQTFTPKMERMKKKEARKLIEQYWNKKYGI